MHSHIERWLNSALSDQPRKFAAPISVTGKIAKQLGPAGGAFAIVALEVSGAPAFEVIDETGQGDDPEVLLYIDHAVFGFLDIAIPAGYFPINRTRVTVRDVRYHPVDSNALWFRLAGRAAARQILAERPDLAFEAKP